MAHYSGSALVVDLGGTVISGDHRTFSWNEQIKTIDTTAGADAAESHVKGTTSLDWSMDVLFENSAAGSAIARMLYSGNSGTLRVYPLGTVTGNPLFSFVTTITGISNEIPYDDAIGFTV